jgi:hypothetical protein
VDLVVRQRFVAVTDQAVELIPNSHWRCARVCDADSEKSCPAPG